MGMRRGKNSVWEFLSAGKSLLFSIPDSFSMRSSGKRGNSGQGRFLHIPRVFWELFTPHFLRTSQNFQPQGRNPLHSCLRGQIPLSFPHFSTPGYSHHPRLPQFPLSITRAFPMIPKSIPTWKRAPKALPHPRRVLREKAATQSQRICSELPKSMDSIPNFSCWDTRSSSTFPRVELCSFRSPSLPFPSQIQLNPFYWLPLDTAPATIRESFPSTK